MRKKTVDEARTTKHDELVAHLLSRKDELIDLAKKGRDVRSLRAHVEIEQPCGNGWIDLCVTVREICSCRGAIDRALIIEVKTESEHWSAGDVIRQLKRYQKSFDYNAGLRSHGEGNCSCHETDASCSEIAFYCDRQLTEQEKKLFEHEDVLVIE